MTSDRWEKLGSLFEAALGLDPAQRAELLSQCGDDDLRAELEDLLLEHHNLGAFLEAPAARILLDETKTLTQDMLSPGDTLGTRYRIIRLVGRGGMGEVYEAEDLELNCRIALKTLRAGAPSGMQSLERFKREVLLGRRIKHPNVCRLFDIDRETVGGKKEVLFLTMEYLAGETLSQRLKRTGPLDMVAARPIVEGMLAGLAACHQLGIVHRDFKSSNVMIVPEPDGNANAILTDFGLAHPVRPENQDGAEVSLDGRIVGTPEYMAPEQKEGKPATEASDIYALGVVLCEMLTGSRPEAGSGSIPPGAHLDRKWQAAILHAMQADPKDRFQNTSEVAAALGIAPRGSATFRKTRANAPHNVRLIVAVALVLLVLLSLGIAYRKAHALPGPKHVAVLSFRNLGNNAGDQVFCEGLTEALASKLSQLERYQKSFWVVPASDSRQLTDPHEAYRRLDATLVVSGTLRRAPDKSVLYIHVIDARNSRQLASRDIVVPAADLSGLEDEAWQRVADMLDLQLRPEEVLAVEAGKARAPGAYVAYAQGIGYLRRNGLENISNAISRFQEAIGKDPNYALPYSGLGSAYELKYEVTKDPQWLELARVNGKRAVELAPDLAQVHFTLGEVALSTGENKDAQRELIRAIELDPGVIEAQYYLGRLYEGEGRLAAAEQELRTAVDRRPGYWRGHSELGTFLYHRGRFREAEAEFTQALASQPDDTGSLNNLGAMYMATGRFEEAVPLFENQVRVQPKNGDVYTNLGSCFLFVQKYAEAVVPMKSAVKLKPDSHDCWRNLGDAYRFAPGREGEAARAYRKALELGRRALAINPKDWETMSSVALYEAHLNNRKEAISLADQSVKMEPSSGEIMFTAALVYEMLGQRRAALEALRGAYLKGYPLPYIEHDPELSALRKEAGYRAWVGSVKAGLGKGGK